MPVMFVTNISQRSNKRNRYRPPKQEETLMLDGRKMKLDTRTAYVKSTTNIRAVVMGNKAK